MKVIHISETGDDKNDGATLATAVRTHKRACKIGGGDCEFRMSRTTLERIIRESEENTGKREL